MITPIPEAVMVELINQAGTAVAQAKVPAALKPVAFRAVLEHLIRQESQ